MSKVDDVRTLFHVFDVVEVIENTCRPEINGVRRRVSKVGKSFVDYTAEYAAELNPSSPVPFRMKGRMYLPTRVKDVLAVDLQAGTCTYRIAHGSCPTPTMTLHVTRYA